MLEQLRSKGYLSAEVFQAQSKGAHAQIASLKAERQSSFESRILGMLEDVRKLRALLSEIEEPLDEFNETLFHDIVKEIWINNRDEMTITFLGGLEFTEEI